MPVIGSEAVNRGLTCADGHIRFAKKLEIHKKYIRITYEIHMEYI